MSGLTLDSRSWIGTKRNLELLARPGASEVWREYEWCVEDPQDLYYYWKQ